MQFEKLRSLGLHLPAARLQRVLSQPELAAKSGLSQTHISYLRSRTALAIARPTAPYCAGPRCFHPKIDRRQLTARERNCGISRSSCGILGVVDLWVNDVMRPWCISPARGADRVRSVAPEEPAPRILEAVPALFAWNEIDPILLQAFRTDQRGIGRRRRLAWLADVDSCDR